MQESIAFEEDVGAPKLCGTLKANIEWHEIVEKDLQLISWMYENDPIAANWLKDYNAHIRLNLCWKFFGAIDIDFVDDSHYEGLKQRHDDACDKRMKRLFAINHQNLTYDEIEGRLSEPLYPYDLPAATCQDLLKETIWADAVV